MPTCVINIVVSKVVSIVAAAVCALCWIGPEYRMRDLNRHLGKSVRCSGRVLSYAIETMYGTS